MIRACADDDEVKILMLLMQRRDQLGEQGHGPALVRLYRARRDKHQAPPGWHVVVQPGQRPALCFRWRRQLELDVRVVVRARRSQFLHELKRPMHVVGQQALSMQPCTIATQRPFGSPAIDGRWPRQQGQQQPLFDAA